MRLFDILKRNELNAPDLDKLNVMSHKTLYATFGEPTEYVWCNQALLIYLIVKHWIFNSNKISLWTCPFQLIHGFAYVAFLLFLFSVPLLYLDIEIVRN